MEKITQKKNNNFAYWLLIISSFFMYIMLTGSKHIYTANKTTFYSLGTFGNLTDLATTFEYYFYTYAVMQVCLVFFMKKINVKWFLTATIGASAILTILMAFTTTIIHHYIIYTINGFLQAGIWGCIFKNLSKYLPKNFLAKGNGLMSSGPAVSYSLSYLVAALFGDNWKLPFIIMGVILLGAVLLYFASVTIVSKINGEQEIATVNHNVIENEKPLIPLNTKKSTITFFAISLLIGFIITSIYFMLNNNLDFFLKEVGGFSNSVCKLLTIIATVSTVIGPIFTVALCEKYNNFLLVGGVLCSISAIVLLPLTFFFEVNVILSLSLFIIFLIIVNGARTISLSISALKQRSVIDTGIYTTAVNALASIAAGLAPKILSIILDNEALSTIQSWRLSFSILLVSITALSLLLLILGFIINKKNNKNLNA